MGQASQAGFHSAGNDGHALVCLAGTLAIGQSRPIGPPMDLPAWTVGVVVADLAIGSVMVEHRVHVAGADGEAQSRTPKNLPGVAGMPIGLAENGNAIAFAFQHPA